MTALLKPELLPAVAKHIGRKLRDCETGTILIIAGLEGKLFNVVKECDGLDCGLVDESECHEASTSHLGCLWPKEHAGLIEPCVTDCFTWVGP